MAQITRRKAMFSIGAAAVSPLLLSNLCWAARNADKLVKRGRLKQSVCRGPYNKIPLPDFCRAVADMGLTAIDLLREDDWPALKDYGLICSMGYAGGGTIPEAFN